MSFMRHAGLWLPPLNLGFNKHVHGAATAAGLKFQVAPDHHVAWGTRAEGYPPSALHSGRGSPITGPFG